MSFKRFFRWSLLILLLGSGLLISCGPSAEEIAATEVALTAAAVTDTPIPTPTDTPTPTATPVPYDLSVIVTGEEDSPIVGAHVVLAEVVDETGSQTTDDVGQVFWYDLPGETVNISISAQGYFPLDVTDSVEHGINQITIALERDPHGVLPSEACAPGESLLYIEDFQDGKAQGWEEIEFRAQGWDLGPFPDAPGDRVVIHHADNDGQVWLQDHKFEDTVFRLQIMPQGRVVIVVANNWLVVPYEIEEGTVNFSAYSVFFDPGGTNKFRAQDPFRTIELGGANPILRRGEWHNIEMSTFDGTFEVWLDGWRILTYKDPHPLPAGTVAIQVWPSEDEGATAYFNNLAVCELTAPFVTKPTPESQ